MQIKELGHLVLYVREVVKIFNEIELYIDMPGVDWKSNPALITAPIKPLAL